MKKILLLAALISPFYLSAQTTIVSENFDNYTAGDYIAVESSDFITWSGPTGTAEDAQVTDSISSSPNNSLHIVGNTGPMDVMMIFPTVYTSGAYELSMKIYVYPGFGGYFNIQESQTPGAGWKLDIFFNTAGQVEILGGVSPSTTQYQQGAWTDIKVDIDLDNDNADVYVNGTLAHSYVFSTGSDGNGTSAAFGGINYFAYGGSSTALEAASYYIDDISLVDNTSSGVGVVDNNIDLSIFPNPVIENIYITGKNLNEGNYKLEIFDISGKLVSAETVYISENFTKEINSSFDTGIYTLSLSNENGVTTKKFIVK
tara:strand:- start:2165 stop:3109 length:945 start_codon:yes stop_codon:yes gene_type:complete